MSAAELRKAAETLRERVDRATPGPWKVSDGFGADTGRIYVVPADDHLGSYVSAGGGPEYDDDADYIATMHPGVGLALADLLEGHATQSAILRVEPAEPWLNLSRLINGGAS